MLVVEYEDVLCVTKSLRLHTERKYVVVKLVVKDIIIKTERKNNTWRSKWVWLVGLVNSCRESE